LNFVAIAVNSPVFIAIAANNTEDKTLYRGNYASIAVIGDRKIVTFSSILRVFFSIINVLWFLKIFRYLDTIVIKHINKILDLVGLHGKNKYNCFVLWTRSLLCLGFGKVPKLSTQDRWCYNN
jgi:hypothetical protein